MEPMATTTTADETATRPAPSWSRRWLFRGLAILLGLSPLLIFEGACRIFDWGRPDVHDDPFVGFEAVRPLFVLNEATGRYEIPKSRQAYFYADSFAARKGPNEFRVFCLGESTMQGNPFTTETALTTWLELSLKAAEPDRTFRVVNCGGISYASYRLLPILNRLLGYQPDLVILCVGHNEFLEARTFEHRGNRGPLVQAALESAARLRTFTLLREGYLHAGGISSTQPAEQRPMLPAEVDAMLDYRGGLAEYHRDDAWREGVIEQYRYNLRCMVEACRAAGVPLILINPVSNFRDSPPFKAEHSASLSEPDRERWRRLCDAAARHLRREHYDLQQAVQLYEQACQLDPLHAGGFYNLAQCYELLGDYDRARAAYAVAREQDVCPLRAVQPINDYVLALARETRTPLLDAQALFERRSKHGIVGEEWLVDHVHPKIEGHQLLANELAQMLVDDGTVRPGADWHERRDAAYRAHFDALSPLYFHKGMQRLRALRNWAYGRAQRLRGEPYPVPYIEEEPAANPIEPAPVEEAAVETSSVGRDLP